MAKTKTRRTSKAQSKRKSAAAQGHTKKVSPPLNTILPTELHEIIFSFLDPVTAACLGVTCKAFKDIFYEPKYYKKVKLSASMDVRDGGPAILKSLLYHWVPADQRFFNSKTGKFMTFEGQKRMIDEMNDTIAETAREQEVLGERG